MSPAKATTPGSTDAIASCMEARDPLRMLLKALCPRSLPSCPLILQHSFQVLTAHNWEGLRNPC